jgi:hypothetical protein
MTLRMTRLNHSPIYAARTTAHRPHWLMALQGRWMVLAVACWFILMLVLW